MNRLCPYCDYKGSGLPWLGRVPAHWIEKRAKYFFREVDERSTTGEETLMSVSHTTGVTPRKSNVTMFKAESNVGHKICRSGDLAINTLWAWMAALGVSRQTGLVSPAYGVYRQLDPANYHPDFIDFLLRTPGYAAEYRRRSTGITTSRLRLYPFEFLRIPLLQPPREEQETIVSYLHDHGALVLRFVRNRRRLIEALNEQKQAIVNQAVTRGVNGAVALKPSGVECSENGPPHWEQRRLKYLVRNVNEQISEKLPDDLYLALEHIESWTGRIIQPAGDVSFDSQVKRFEPNDVLFGKLRPYLAKVTRPEIKGVCVSEFLVLRTRQPRVLPEFLEQKLRSEQIITAVNGSTFGAKMPRAEWTFIGNLTIAFPPTHDEQRAILRTISEQTAALAAAINYARREIELVSEYRTRLIADVVTGKLDVRDVGPSGPKVDINDLENNDLETMEDLEEEVAEEDGGNTVGGHVELRE